jgi:hypothetical protein
MFSNERGGRSPGPKGASPRDRVRPTRDSNLGARERGRMNRWPHNPDTLSRKDLEDNRMRDLYAAEVDPTRTLSDVRSSPSP